MAVVHAGGECHDFKSPDDLSSCVQDDEVFRLARALPSGTVLSSSGVISGTPNTSPIARM